METYCSFLVSIVEYCKRLHKKKMTELICKNIYIGKTGQNGTQKLRKTGQNASKIQEKRGKIMYDKEKRSASDEKTI